MKKIQRGTTSTIKISNIQSPHEEMTDGRNFNI